MNQLVVVIATVHWPGWASCASTWPETAAGPFTRRIIEGRPLLEAYQQGLEETQEPIVGYVHDDLRVQEKGWDARVLAEFEDPRVGLVGFGGGLGHGDPEMYRKPYELVQLARRGYRSNTKDAEVNGERFKGECDVAVLDGMALFVRREVLLKAKWYEQKPLPEGRGTPESNPDGWNMLKGWPPTHGTWHDAVPIGYIGYDYWLCCHVRRQGYRIRLAGVACDHLNGKSTGLGPQVITGEDFAAAHRYIYDTCRDVLPYEVAR